MFFKKKIITKENFKKNPLQASISRFVIFLENRAYNSDSKQSTTYSQLKSNFAVDGLLYTCSITQFPAKVSFEHC